MCFDPITIATFAVSAVSTVAGFQAQNEEAKAAQESAAKANDIQQNALTTRQIQEDNAAVQKVAQQRIEEAKASSIVAVSGAEANATGLSLDSLLGDVQRVGATNRETIRTNAAATAQQLQNERKGVSAQAQSRINASPHPSPLGLVAGLAGDALGAYQKYDRRNKMMS